MTGWLTLEPSNRPCLDSNDYHLSRALPLDEQNDAPPKPLAKCYQTPQIGSCSGATLPRGKTLSLQSGQANFAGIRLYAKLFRCGNIDASSFVYLPVGKFTNELSLRLAHVRGPNHPEDEWSREYL